MFQNTSIFDMTSFNPMDDLSQIDISNPDHVSVISNEDRVTFSVKKGARSMNISFPISSSTTDGTQAEQQIKPIHPDAPVKMLVSKITGNPKPGMRGNPKLTEADVREIRAILSSKDMMAEYGNKHRAYCDIGNGYGVSKDTIANIHMNRSWRHVKI